MCLTTAQAFSASKQCAMMGALAVNWNAHADPKIMDWFNPLYSVSQHYDTCIESKEISQHTLVSFEK